MGLPEAPRATPLGPPWSLLPQAASGTLQCDLCECILSCSSGLVKGKEWDMDFCATLQYIPVWSIFLVFSLASYIQRSWSRQKTPSLPGELYSDRRGQLCTQYSPLVTQPRWALLQYMSRDKILRHNAIIFWCSSVAQNDAAS